MKKQKFFHLTFVFDNFNYSFGRNVLEMLLRDRFSIKVDDGGFDNPGGVRLAEMFKRQYPSVSEIKIYRVDGMTGEGAANNFGQYVILKLS